MKETRAEDQDIIFCQNCQKVVAVVDDHFCQNCGEMICLFCGCTDSEACPETCSWARAGVCSNCADKEGLHAEIIADATRIYLKIYDRARSVIECESCAESDFTFIQSDFVVCCGCGTRTPYELDFQAAPVQVVVRTAKAAEAKQGAL